MWSKKIVAVLLAGTMLSFGVAQVLASERIGLEINGKEISTISAPVVVDNRTLVPARAVLEALGATVTWEQKTQKIYVDMENTNIVFQIDNDIALVNGKEMEMEVGPKIISNATMIPVRFAAELLGYDVDWNSESNSVVMKTSEKKNPQSAETGEIIIEKPIQSIENNNEEIEIIIKLPEGSGKSDGNTESGDKNNENELESSPINVKEICYDEKENKLILPKGLFNFNTDLFEYTDDYLNNKYTINLGDNYSQIYPDNIYKVNNEKISSIEVITIDNKTKIVFNEKQIYAYRVKEYKENIIIEVVSPKEIYEKIVVLDAGHGGKDPGNVNNNVVEKTVNLNVSNRVRELLESDGKIKVYVTRFEDVYPSFEDRVSLANNLGDMFVSIHCNAMGNNTYIKGVQVFYPNPSDNRGKLSKQMAEIFNQTMTENTGLDKKSADQTLGYSLYVLRKTSIPACLIELGFLTNTYDAQILSSDEGVEAMAKAIYKGINMSFEEVVK